MSRDHAQHPCSPCSASMLGASEHGEHEHAQHPCSERLSIMLRRSEHGNHHGDKGFLAPMLKGSEHHAPMLAMLRASEHGR